MPPLRTPPRRRSWWRRRTALRLVQRLQRRSDDARRGACLQALLHARGGVLAARSGRPSPFWRRRAAPQPARRAAPCFSARSAAASARRGGSLRIQRRHVSDATSPASGSRALSVRLGGAARGALCVLAAFRLVRRGAAAQRRGGACGGGRCRRACASSCFAASRHAVTCNSPPVVAKSRASVHRARTRKSVPITFTSAK
jgi:hypothetical protein